MKELNKVFVKFAGAGAVAVLLATPSFAATRGADAHFDDRDNQRVAQTSRGSFDDRRGDATFDNRGNSSYDDRGSNSYDRRSYRENERVNATGRVTAFSRERDGYRVQLDRGGSFFVPQSRLRNHLNDLRVGINVTLGGIFRGGLINVDAVSWPGDNGGYYDRGDARGFMRGVVERVDYRRDVLTLRDERTGRLVDVDLRGTERSSRIDANDLRRGDLITLSGDWTRGGIFSAYRIDSVRTR